MGAARFWIIAGGAAWLPVALAGFAWLVPRAESRPLSRAAGGRCLLGAVLGVGLLVLALWATSDLSPQELPWTAIQLVARLGLAAFLVAFAAHVEPGREILGLERRSASGDVLRGAGIYVAFVPVIVAAHILNALFAGGDVDTVQKTFRDVLSQDGPARVAMILNVVLAVPLFEELLFRGLLQQGIKAQLAVAVPTRQASVLSVVLASVAFTALHDPATYIFVFVLSLILGSAFERSGRILVAVALHAVHNLAVVLYQWFVPPWGGGP